MEGDDDDGRVVHLITFAFVVVVVYVFAFLLVFFLAELSWDLGGLLMAAWISLVAMVGICIVGFLISYATTVSGCRQVVK